jgi:hypothetical protein
MTDSTSTMLDSQASWLFVFAHPGHELRAHHIMERVRPVVAVITDGSGGSGRARVGESRALLEHVGARAAPVFGALADRDAYAALMAVDAEPFLRLVDPIADLIAAERVRAVLVDAAEGYNPVHDVCHWVGRAAVERALRRGVAAGIFELDLVAHPDGRGSGLRLTLDDEAFARKMDAAARYESLRLEAEAAFERYGRNAFRVELLRSVEGEPPPESWAPYYEQVGEARVRTGRYASVLRYASHVRPVIDALIGLARPASHADDLRPLHQ